jgi:hypothetical protein
MNEFDKNKMMIKLSNFFDTVFDGRYSSIGLYAYNGEQDNELSCLQLSFLEQTINNTKCNCHATMLNFNETKHDSDINIIFVHLITKDGVPDIDISHTKYLEKASSNCIYCFITTNFMDGFTVLDTLNTSLSDYVMNKLSHK